MTKLKSYMSDVAPINAMPSKKHLNKIEMAAKLAKHVPHPGVQKVAHATELAVKVAKGIDKKSTIKRKKTKKKTLQHE